MCNKLFFHDGDTGQIIVPVLRSGNSHSNKWYVSILKRIIPKIYEAYPEICIVIILADSRFGCPAFYLLADSYDLQYAIASDTVLKLKTSRVEKTVNHLYLNQDKKHQHFIGYNYGARSWQKTQQCYCKIESTRKGSMCEAICI